ncbi:M12 family metallo-peptidase [Mariniflexile soesokkakense]|uniref:M12 family metallo-peptidase n=1 Tax=Mariniflexile soesokkakense TaxID=1343160 RepID=A0ABV0AB72_9FLAO
MKAKLHYVFSIAMFLAIFSVSSQNSSWKKMETIKDSKIISNLNLDKNKIHVFELNIVSLKESLLGTIARSSITKQKATIISIPAEAGKLETFKIYEASVFAPDLAAKYPNIKSYVGVSTNNFGTRLRMSVSPQGVQTMISYVDKSTVFMQSTSKGSNEYVLYSKSSKDNSNSRFECKTIDDINKTFNKNSITSKIMVNEGGANNQTLQKFRIAISTTAEYTAYHDDGIPGNGDAVADALAAINNTLNRVNEVFETDMAVTFELINAPQLIYTDAGTDPYSDANVGADEDNFDNTNGWSLQLQNNLTNTIGNGAYDIGHLFGATGGGGIAGCIGCVCDNDTPSSTDHKKGSGFTSPSNGVPNGDTFDIDFVAHEIGHQMGASHTFAYENEGSGVNSEPGSGTTIMAYAGITGSNNVTLNSDPYFHYQSIKQILNTLSAKSCQTTEVITNNPPIANAGADFSIPAGTAYVLKGAATDADGGDNLTYCWEQIDSGNVNYLNFGPELASGSTNRSLPPSSVSNRYIPKLSSVLAGNTTQSNPTLGSDWETVSTVGRNLNWALTVRDRATASASGGQSSFDTMKITVENVTPFTVSNPVSWAQGSNVTINWVIGQTTNGTINCQNVNIKLSIDGGLTFPTIIASNTLNDGTYTYTVPTIPNTSTARLLVEAADNIFYDVSNFDFSISPNPDFFMVEETLDPIACAATTATFHFNYVAANGFSENTVFSATNLPSGASAVFSPTQLANSGTVTMTINNLSTEGYYTPTIVGTSLSTTKNKDINLPFFNGLCNSIASTEYETSTTLVQFNTINNSSGKPSGYNNYTNISTNVNRSNAYNLTIKANTDGDFDTSTKVWIDWNQNCSFNDAGEEYNLGTVTNATNGSTSNSPLSITIPVGANLGNTIMRVSTKFNDDGLPNSCENGFDGEVEDYTLNIMPTLAIEEFGFDNFKVFPNPNNGRFVIQLNGSLERAINVAVFDIRGRNIYKNVFPNVGDFKQELQLSNVQSGMYILIVSDGLRKSTKKIVIE